MEEYRVSPSEVKPHPETKNWTLPRTWGVWEVPLERGTQRFCFGNYPVRGRKLESERGAATLIALYTHRDAAERHAASLNQQ